VHDVLTDRPPLQLSKLLEKQPEPLLGYIEILKLLKKVLVFDDIFGGGVELSV
jgi:hypothetical protein